jgi:hypothetical protein
MAYLSLDLLGEHAHPRRGWTPVNLFRRTGQRRNLMIEVDLTAAAFELVRDGVIAKSRKSGMVKVLMPKNLAAHLDAARFRRGHERSDPAPGQGGEDASETRFLALGGSAVATLAFAQSL